MIANGKGKERLDIIIKWIIETTVVNTERLADEMTIGFWEHVLKVS